MKEAVRRKSFEDLIEKKETYSKGEELQYGQLSMRPYMKANRLNAQQGINLFKIRTRMLDVKNNYKNGNLDLRCPCCFLEIDTQEHMLTQCVNISTKITKREYVSIFGNDEDPIINICDKIDKIINERKLILK